MQEGKEGQAGLGQAGGDRSRSGLVELDVHLEQDLKEGRRSPRLGSVGIGVRLGPNESLGKGSTEGDRVCWKLKSVDEWESIRWKREEVWFMLELELVMKIVQFT